jgi:outer membrane protein TolC
MTTLMKKQFLILLCVSIFVHFSNAQQLDYFIAQGLQNSPLLNDYRNTLNAAAVDSLLIKAANKPQVNNHSQILYAPAYKNFGYDDANTNGGTYSSVVDVSQVIFNRNVLQNKYNNASLQKQSLQNTLKISMVDLKKAITTQYLTAFADYADMKNNSAYLELLNQHKAMLKQLVEHGVYKQSDYVSLIIEMQTAQIDLSQQQTQIMNDVFALKQLCGITDTTRFKPEKPALAVAQTVNISTSPLFMQFKLDSLKITNEHEGIDVSYKPKIGWYADAGLLSADPAQLYRHLGYSIGLNMCIPIFDGHQRSLQYRKLDMRENTRSQYASYFKKQYSGRVQQLTQQLQMTQQSLDLTNVQLSTTNELLAMLKTQLNNGNATIVDLINTMKNYLLVTRNINKLHMQECGIINELNYLMQQ